MLSPCLLARLFFRSARWPELFAVAGVMAIALNSAVPLLLHVAGCPITRISLAGVHLLLLLILLVACRICRPGLPPDPDPEERRLIGLFAAFAVLVLPITCLAGIDTYKWQDLATSVAVEGRIAWLIHPLSLLGFTPRAYPGAQPLTLATAQVLGGLGVETGYYAVSLLSGATGIFGAAMLGRRLFTRQGSALLAAFLYGFSPVFIRYNHWATGRGFVLALLPVYMMSALALPRARGWLAFAFLSFLLALSHKAGLVAVPLICISLVAAPLLPRRMPRSLLYVLAVLVLSAVVVAAPRVLLPPPFGQALGALRADITRFAWMTPLGVAGIVAAAKWFNDTARRRLLPMLLVTFPLAHHPEMYGALLALPLVCMAATDGIEACRQRFPRGTRHLLRGMVMITLVGAVAILANRSLAATPRAVRAAARFLERHDPAGPYIIDAPAYTPQLQAYVSGCPRFAFETQGPVQLRLRVPCPAPDASIPGRMKHWIILLRDPFVIHGVRTWWYGENPAKYSITINSAGRVPAGFEKLYEDDGVAVFGQMQPGDTE